MRLNIWVEFEFASFTIQTPRRYRCSLLRSFADWTGTRLPSVHSLSDSVCRGPVCSSYMARATSRGALAISGMSHTAIAWSPDGISIHWSGAHRSEGNDAGDGFWNPLLRSVNEYVLEPLHFPDFLSIHLLFWEGWTPGVSLHQLLGEHALVIVAQMMAMQVEETHRNTSNHAHPLLKPCAMHVWNPV